MLCCGDVWNLTDLDIRNIEKFHFTLPKDIVRFLQGFGCQLTFLDTVEGGKDKVSHESEQLYTLRKNSSLHCISSSQSPFCRYSIEWAD